MKPSMGVAPLFYCLHCVGGLGGGVCSAECHSSFIFILKPCNGRHSGSHKNVMYYYLIYLILLLTTADADDDDFMCTEFQNNPYDVEKLLKVTDLLFVARIEMLPMWAVMI